MNTFTRDPAPDPQFESELGQQRLRQWRSHSLDPFEPSIENGAKPEAKRMPSSYSTNTQASGKDGSLQDPSPQHQKSVHPELKHPGSSWVYLFYDLAWAASFASLTGNGKFDNPLDTLNYLLFFAAVYWLWASQTLYSVHFYTNDWFHLWSAALQLFIFGMLAATTQGYDVTTYIAHSPGMQELVKNDGNDDSDPELYAEKKKAYLSILVLAIAFVATRIIHLVQYLRVLYYAMYTKRGTRGAIPPQLVAITTGLSISFYMFSAALGIAASSFGESVLGASLKLGLWVGGFAVEIFSHFIIPFYWWIKGQENPTNKLPVSGTELYERLETITTIILGEGINGIAGTLSNVLVAPGVGRTVGGNVVTAALTICFLAYIYFEGPNGDRSPPLTSLRHLLWLMLHLLFLASTVLLLIGMKNQFLLTSFISALFRTTADFNHIINNELTGHGNATYWRTNANMTHFMLTRGLVWEEEFNKFWNASMNATAAEAPMVMPVWSLRLSLTMAINVFKDFNAGDDAIPSDLQPLIDNFNENFTQVVEDINISPINPKEAAYYQVCILSVKAICVSDLIPSKCDKILSGLLDGFILSTRCIIGFAGLILICLSLQDYIHTRPDDRYQWGVITSRFSMGIVLCLLLLLNIGKYQELFVPQGHESQRAGIFLWLEAFWVLPTIAIAYGMEFIIEVILAKYAIGATKKDKIVEQVGSPSNSNKEHGNSSPSGEIAVEQREQR
ncbi:hypothetical protein RSOLAG22IIIB_04124 [Rhizoctonia solani]|uniref:Uncharacterized protein n=1 Tax=Rhizoctonia solani TaxID=456999 RepID=A0A0K6FUN8_9AGAM|nr:hypothetical protein RSOLAG22IIIB_04124 [Rhizoctonia solani]